MYEHSAVTVPVIRPMDADPQTGSLSGFEIYCPACGFRFTTSLYSIALADSREHVAYMIRKERKA